MDSRNALGRPLSAAKIQQGEKLYYFALILFGVLSCFFTSSIQSTLPDFSRMMRLGLSGLVALLLLVKTALFTPLSKKELAAAAVFLAIAALLSYTSDDRWLAATFLIFLASKKTDPERALFVFSMTASLCILLTFLLHPLGLVPWNFFPHRSYDFGFGHYNGFAGRIFGIYLAWLVLLFKKLSRWWAWVLLALVPFVTYKATTSRGGTAACIALYAVLLAYRLLPALFEHIAVKALMVAAYIAAWCFSLYGMTAFDSSSSFWVAVNRYDNMRFSNGNLHYLEYPIRLLGGDAVDTGPFTALDNAYMATLYNKGIVGAVVVFVLFLLLLLAFLRFDSMVPALALCVIFLYGMTENRILNLYVDPLFMWAGVILFPEYRDALAKLFSKQG